MDLQKGKPYYSLFLCIYMDEITIIPKHLPDFKTITLLFVCDTTRAKWYVIKGKELKKTGTIERRKIEYADKGDRFNLDEIERVELDSFSKKLVESLAKETKVTGAKHIIVSVPQRIKGAFEKCLSPDLKKKIILHHDANLYRFNGLEILKLIYK